MTRADPEPALPTLPGLDPAWSRRVDVTDADGVTHRWHLLDTHGDPAIERADGPVGTLLCVHGNPTWSYLWRGLLASPPSGWRVVAPDQLGMGWSERLSAPRTLAQRVRDLGDLTAALGMDGPVVTVGHDWGGSISLGWALAHRDRLRGIVLTNTAVAQPPGDRGPALIRLAHAPALRRLGCVKTPAFVRAATALSRPPLPRDVRRALAAPYSTAARRQAVGDFVADIPFAPGHPSRAPLERIAEGVRGLDVPALLLWGPRDPVFGERYLADLRARLPQAQLHRFEGAAHLLTEDAPEYAAAVARWVGDLDAGPPRAEPPAAGAGRRAWTALEARSDDASAAVVEVRGHARGAVVSWAELHQRVRDLAAGVAGAGIRPGDRVGLLVEPSADLTTVVYALWRAGAVVVVADKGLGLLGMRRALRSAAVDHVVGATPGLLAARALGVPGSRIATGIRSAAQRRRLGADHDLGGLEELGRTAATPPEPGLDDPCAVVFTSGATGPAKGVVYHHRQLSEQLDLVRATYAIGPDDRLVAAFAPFALLGPALGIGSVVPDIDVTAPGTLTAAALGDAAAAVDATIVFASPAALRRVVATADRVDATQRRALSRIRLLMSAGAPVPAAMLESLQAVLPGAALHTPYGMTEVLPVTDVSLEEIQDAGSGRGVCVGRPLPGVEVAVSALGVEGTAEEKPAVAPGATGEICVRAAHVKVRYDALWATERASSRDVGWHRTGDVGHLDEQGRLWVEGRLAHLVTTAAGVVTPVPIEQRLESLPGVAAAALVGVGPAGTQAAVAVIVPIESLQVLRSSRRRRLALADTATTVAVRAAAGTHLAAVLVTSALPVDIRHASKVDRLALARRAARLLSGLR